MPLFAWIIIGVTVALAVLSVITRKRCRPHQPIPPHQPAPWEREGGRDLTTPTGVISGDIAPQAPVGARMRPADHSGKVSGAIMDDVVKGLQRIPPLPQALMQLLRELDSAGSMAKSVAQIVATEPVLTATLLRVANSASTGLRREIITVPEAVTYLGFSTVKSLFLKLQMGKLFPRTQRGGCYDSEKLWVHSMAVAQVAEDLAVRAGNVDPSLALTLGLLHDIGKVAVNAQFPDAVAKLWTSNGAADESFLARERRLFGADHAFLGGYLAAQWKLPEDLVEMIRLHHSTEAALAGLRPELRRALNVVQVANQVVKYCHVYCEDMEIDIIPPEVAASLGLPADIDKLVDAKLQRLVARAALMNGEDSPQSIKPAAA